LAEKTPFSFPPGPVSVRDVGYFEDMGHRAEREYARNNALGKIQGTAWVRQMLLHLMTELTQPPSVADAALEQILASIRQQPHKWRTVSELAARMHLSPSQFTRRFFAATEVSPRHFQIRARLERARQLLEETDMTLQHIAFALGYQDHFFCARQYKQWMGETPGATRRKTRM
jgi:transcriptional regulator GlxA family with amidase domain